MGRGLGGDQPHIAAGAAPISPSPDRPLQQVLHATVPPKRVEQCFFPRKFPAIAQPTMYTISGRQHVTPGDFQFMKEIGIEPSGLDDPFPCPLPPPPPPEATIPKLTEEDPRWLLNLGLMLEHEVKPKFVPPKTLREYLARYPTGIREAVGEVAKELGLALPDGDLDDMAQDLIVMVLDFAALGLEDIVEMYAFHPPVRPGESRSAHFRDYMRLRVMACVQVMLQSEPTGTDDSSNKSNTN